MGGSWYRRLEVHEREHELSSTEAFKETAEYLYYYFC